MDLVIQEKIESCILNGLGYNVRLENKNVIRKGYFVNHDFTCYCKSMSDQL